MHLKKLLQVAKDLVWLVTKDDQQGYWKHVENIQKEYLKRDRTVPDGERESSDTEDGSDCSSSEDMDL